MAEEIKVFSDEYEEYLRDESRRSGSADRIVFAKSDADVSAALQEASQNNWPVTIQGARTGITAGAVPEGGLILNLSRMKSIGEIHDSRLTVQPGALLTEIRDAAEKEGLMFTPDPTETSASIGGMLACNASGACTFSYGPTRDWINSLCVVLANGETVRLERGVDKAAGQRFTVGTVTGELPDIAMPEVKSAAGYYVKEGMDLIDLFIGMEGTLGVVTEVELKLIPQPAAVNGLTAFFPDEEAALKFVRFLRESAAPPVAIEFFDFQALELLRRMKTENAAFAELPEMQSHFHTAIYFEFHGDDADALEEQVMEAAEMMMELGAGEDDCWFAGDAREIETLKKFRHSTPEAVNLLIDQRKKACPELTKLGTDMSVPDRELENVMRMYHDGLATAGLEHVIFGHIGNNHVHVNIIPRDMDEYAKGKALYLDWAEKVVAMGGSVSAEHGIGKIKVPFLKLMFGEDGIAEMKKLKELFDPQWILNQGNLF
ncbi:MAG: FAD-binding oxidoreductase [Kiritimatiellales bacterium]|nr:FAD-binding oxidoreductase [Kiritimatiellales bacterium]